MAKQTINIGTNPNDNTGDALRDALDKCNDNFTELYDGKLDVTLTDAANDDFIQRKSGVWVNRTLAQVRTDLKLTNAEGNNTDIADRFLLNSIHSRPSVVALESGVYYNFARSNDGTGTNAPGQNIARLQPIFFDGADNFTFNEIGVASSTAGTVGTGNGTIAIYDSDANFRPNAKLGEWSISSLNAGTGWRQATVNPTFTLQRGKLYWTAVHLDSDVTLRTLPNSGTLTLGVSSNTATTQFKCVQRTITFATGLPSSWVWSVAEKNTNNQIDVRFRLV